MDPRVWGTDLWKSLHRISLAYPLQPSAAHQEDAYVFFKALGNMLPCPWCSIHYNKYFEETFVKENANKNRESLARWVYDLHESVNKRLGKPTFTVPFEKLPFEYMVLPQSYLSQESMIAIIVAGFIIATLLAVMIAIIVICKDKDKTPEFRSDSPLFIESS
jgi:Erv1 / Alr family